MLKITLIAIHLFAASLLQTSQNRKLPVSIDPYLDMVENKCEFARPCLEGEDNSLKMTITMVNKSSVGLSEISAKIIIPDGGKIVSQSISKNRAGPGEKFTVSIQMITFTCDINRILVSFDGIAESGLPDPPRTQALTASIALTGKNCGFHVSCFGGSDGSATATASGGNSPYTFQWSNGQTGSSVSGLTAGMIAVKVTDSDGNIAFANINVTQPPPIVVNNLFQHASGPTNNDGNIQLNVYGGCPAYSFQWTGPNNFTAGSPNIANVPPGTYNVVVTDQNGCSVSKNYNLVYGNNDNISPVISCPQNIVTNAANGTCAANVNYTPPVGTDNQPNPVTQLVAGLPPNAGFPVGVTANIWQVTDGAGNKVACVFTVQVIDNQPPVANCQNATVNLDANGNVFVSGSAISNSSADNCGIAFLTSVPSTFGCSNTGSNSVTLDVKDIHGNSSSCNAVVNVIDNTPPSIACPSNITATNVSGQAGATVYYSAPTVTDNCGGSSSSLTSGLGSGSFFPLGSTTESYTATDANGNNSNCSFTVTVVPDSIVLVLSSPTVNCGYNLACTGATSGSVNLTVSGGVSPYSFQWTGPGTFSATTEDLSNLGAGTYSIAVTDNAAGSMGGSITLTEPMVLKANLTSPVYNCGYNFKCPGVPDGGITTTPGGGCPPYTYSWSNGATTPGISNLFAGTYSVAIADANNWTTTESITLTEPPPFNIAITSTDATGPTAQDGSINMTVSGACPPYTFEWKGPNNYTTTVQSPVTLSWGWYTVTVTDGNQWQTTPPPTFISCIPLGCVVFSYHSLTFMISTTNEDKKNPETKEGWSMRTGTMVNEDFPPTGDNSLVKITSINAVNDAKDSPKFSASFGGSPISDCKACNGACDAVSPDYVTGTKYGSYETSIISSLCPPPNNCGGTKGMLDIGRLDANGPDKSTSKDQFPQKTYLLPKRSGVLVTDPGTPKECIVGEPVIIVLSGGVTTIAGEDLGAAGTGIQSPGFYGVQHDGLDKWTFEAKDDGYDATKHDRQWYIELAGGGGKTALGAGKTLTHTFDLGRWNVILEYKDIASGLIMGKAEIHSIVVEETHTDNVAPRNPVLDCPEGSKFEILGKAFPGAIIDLSLYGRGIAGSGAGGPRARISIDGYPQNEYWGLASDAYDIPQVISVKHTVPDSAFLQGYQNTSKVPNDIKLHTDAQAFLEACSGNHKYRGTPANWRWENSDIEKFSVVRLEGTYAKCNADSLVNFLCIISPSEGVVNKLQNGGGMIDKNKIPEVLADSLKSHGWFGYVKDPTEKGPKVAIRVISFGSNGKQMDELKENGARLEIDKCKGGAGEYSSDRLWLVPDDKDPKTSLDDDKTTLRAEHGGHIILEYWSPSDVRVCQKKFRILDLDIDTENVHDSNESTKGQIVWFNRDNDDFNPAGVHNYDPDWKQSATVDGENDLKKITLLNSLGDLNKGEIRLAIRKGLTGAGANDTRIKVWDSPAKDNLILDGVTKEKKWTVTEFRKLAPIDYWVEGYRPSTKIKDVVLSLNWRRNATDANPQCEDLIAITAVDIYLDVNADVALVDDNKWYKNGYDGIAKFEDEGTPVLTAASNYTQEMKLLIAPAEVGKKKGKILTSVEFELRNTTQFTGVAMNFGTQNNTDFSLKADANILSANVDTSISDIVRQAIFCRDYGGKTIAEAIIKRDGVTLAICELPIPKDTDRDLLPDWYERKYQNDTLRATLAAGGNIQVFDTIDDNTKVLAAIPIANHASGVPAVAAVPSAQYDNETQALPPDVGNVVGGANGGGPAVGLTGDGLTAIEEYRGFFYGDDANTANSHIHHRINTHRKDLFANSTGVVDQGTDLGIGYLTALRNPVNVYAHRINVNEWQNTASRIINHNRDATGMNLPAWQGPQRALRIINGVLGIYGLAEPGNLNTGQNGICETTVPPGPPLLDQQIIPAMQGSPNSVTIHPGPNGIIDPPKSPADVIDAVNHRILMGSDGNLNTVVVGYSPPGNDRVVAKIESGLDAVINPATAATSSPSDVANLTITGDAADPLDPGTVTGAPVNEIDLVIIHPNGNGIDAAAGIHANDTKLANGTVSPFNPSTSLNDGFQTAVTGNDYFMGTINKGSDNVLNAVPNGNDIITGTIDPGADLILQSRPVGDDIVVGYIDGGPAGDPDGGKLNPLINNGIAEIAGFPGNSPANDDVWSFINDNIHSGPDGVCHTLVQAGSDDIAEAQIPDGQGLPFQVCVNINDGDGNIEYGPPGLQDDDMQSVAGGDDQLESGGATNETPNEADDIIVDVALHNTVDASWNGSFESIAAVNDNPNLAIPLALRRDDADFRIAAGFNTRRRNLIRESIAHECGHGIHINHYFTGYVAAAGGVTAGNGPTVHGEVWAAAPVNPDNMCTNAGVVCAPITPVVGNNTVPSTYDNTSIRQIRVHLKHP